MQYNYEYILDYFKFRGYILLDDKYISVKSNISIVDKEGYKYHLSFDTFYQGERKCKFIYRPEKFSKRNKYTYENIKLFIEKNIDKFYLSGGEYVGSSKKTLICCCFKYNHLWYTTLDHIQKRMGCPYCNGKIPSDENNLLLMFPEIVKEWDYTKNLLSPREYTKCSSKKVFWICENNHSWKSAISNRVTFGFGCPICSSSHGEKAIMDFLISKNIDFCRQKKFDDLIGLDYGYLKFDFCVYDKSGNIFSLIEFQGEQHFHSIDYFGGEDKFFKCCCHDAYKRYYCKNNNLRLIEIDYNNLNNVSNILEKELWPLLERRYIG